jgi:PmbA protein
MYSREEAMQVVETALRATSADQAEVMLSASEQGLTRLANGGVHQHVATATVGLQVRAVLGTRIGVARTNDLSADGVTRVAARAVAIARVAEPNPEFVSLPAPIAHPRGESVAELPTLASPDALGEAASALIRVATGQGLTASGRVSESVAAYAIGNSLGTRAYMATRESTVMSIMTQGEASGYAYWSGEAIAGAPAIATAERAAQKCLLGKEPVTVDPGAYTVILEPSAVAEMLSLLGWIGLGALAFREQRSFMSGRLGERVAGENVTLRDDAYHPLMGNYPYDFEGVPRQAVPLIARGVARGVVWDSYHATAAGVPNTGHALPAPNSGGPYPLHLVLEPGEQSYEELLAGVERGILVTRFHYVNIVHPMETTLTGMTRDGTFLIKGGRITRPVKNLRFTQSVLGALSHVTGLERTPTLVNQEGLFCVVPTMRVEGFTFTS